MGFRKKIKTATTVVLIATINKVKSITKDLEILANCKEHGNEFVLLLSSQSAVILHAITIRQWELSRAPSPGAQRQRSLQSPASCSNAARFGHCQLQDRKSEAPKQALQRCHCKNLAIGKSWWRVFKEKIIVKTLIPVCHKRPSLGIKRWRENTYKYIF